jgi:CRP-like cAMP-binding protein
MINTLFEIFGKIHPLSDAFKLELIATCKNIEIRNSEILMRAGHVCHNMYFVCKGLLRGYYNTMGKKVTTRFMEVGDICIAPHSFFSRTISSEGIQAASDSFLYYLTFEEINTMCRQFPEFHTIIDALLLKSYLMIDETFLNIRVMGTVARYTWLKNKFPDLVRKASASYIASYIGVAEETLSRIKKEIKLRENRQGEQ